MTDGQRSQVLEAVVRLEDLIKSFAEIGACGNHEGAKELVRLRRELATQVAAVASLARAAIEANGGEARDEFRRLNSSLLSNLALHQASWPAVRLLHSATAEEYVRSAKGVDRACRNLISWLRLEIKKM